MTSKVFSKPNNQIQQSNKFTVGSIDPDYENWYGTPEQLLKQIDLANNSKDIADISGLTVVTGRSKRIQNQMILKEKQQQQKQLEKKK